MATNKDDIGGNRTGILDYDAFTVTKIDKKDGGESVYSLEDFFKRYDGLEISISVTAAKEAPLSDGEWLDDWV